MASAGWRIGLDVAPLRGRPAGVGVYVANLARALAEQLPGRLVLLGRRADAEVGDLALERLPQTPFSRRHYHFWMQLEASRAARRSRVALVHFTNAAAPILARPPCVVTIHDLSVLRMPRAHPWPRLATLPVSLLAMRRARRLIVPSQATADELVRLLRVDDRRISVVAHAASPPGTADGHDALEALGLQPGGYLLAMGTLEPRKNHRRLIEAFELLAARGHDLRLVISGDVGWNAGPLLRRIAASPERERMTRTGYLPPAELGQLIRASAAVCYVSLYEGYGLPVIEAMAAGAAVVTSNTSSMPEVAGGAAVLVDPHDPHDIADGIERALADRDALIEAGRRRAASRSWADVARETIDVYRTVLDG